MKLKLQRTKLIRILISVQVKSEIDSVKSEIDSVTDSVKRDL